MIGALIGAGILLALFVMLSRYISARRFASLNTPKSQQSTKRSTKPISRVIDPSTEQFSRIETNPAEAEPYHQTYGYEYGTGDVEMFNASQA